VPLTMMVTQKKNALNFMDLSPVGEKSEKNQEAYERAEGAWGKLKTIKLLPIGESLDKRNVIVYCKQGLNRSPRLAAGYAQFAAQSGQRVIVLNGGWDNYKKSLMSKVKSWEKGKKQPPLRKISVPGVQPSGDVDPDPATLFDSE